MTRNFCRWEVDPFFSAAEEVQDSADRLESVYRTWIHAKSVLNDIASAELYRRELGTALGTAKWQLEEFERAVSHLTADDCDGTGDNAPARHQQFINALRNQITSIETAFLDSKDCRDMKAYPIVSLAEEEKHDLALFLCGRSSSTTLQYANLLCSSPPKVVKSEGRNLSATSSSLEPKDGRYYSSRTVAPHSATELANASIIGPDVPYWTREGRCTDKLVPDSHGINMPESSAIKIDGISKPVSDPRSDYFHSDRGEIFAERVNGHQRSISVGSGLDSWKSGSVNVFRSKTRRNVFEQIPTKRFQLLSIFAKARQLKHWGSGIKRWKDGDANESDSQMIGLMQVQKDVENGNSSAWFGGSPNCFSKSGPCGSRGENMHNRALEEGPQIWQQSQYAFPASRPVQIGSAILVALGLVGLLSFHVSPAAL